MANDGPFSSGSLGSTYDPAEEYRRWNIRAKLDAMQFEVLKMEQPGAFGPLPGETFGAPVPSTWSEYSALMSAEPMGNP